jgi:multiple sugar transport system substrate-binding protein
LGGENERPREKNEADKEGAMKRLVIVLAAFGLLAAACTAGTEDQGAPEPIATGASASHDPVTISMWIPFGGAEAEKVLPVFDMFEKQYPWITVDVHKGFGENDDKVLAAIRSGTPPDAVMSWSLDSVGKFCASGAWQDLTPYIEQSNLDTSIFPDSVTRYTSYAGSQCALPFLTDAMGLYYNKDLLQKAGFTEPPKTMSQLTEMAKALTVFNPDGSIKVAGFVPWFGYYEFTPLELAIIFGADYYNEDGTQAAISSDPQWAELFRWQKDLVDFYGEDNLKEFVAGSGNEWTAGNDFQHGRVAMMFDGEWRVAMIEDYAPNLNYGTAPYPAPDDDQSQYGLGRVGGTIIGIPRGSPHPAEAWALVQYLATNTDALVAMTNSVRNVPTTYPALESPALDVTPQFQTFMDIFGNQGSHYKQTSEIGTADQDLVEAFGADWQAGDVPDLEAGLEQLNQQVNDELEQAQI